MKDIKRILIELTMLEAQALSLLQEIDRTRERLRKCVSDGANACSGDRP